MNPISNSSILPIQNNQPHDSPGTQKHSSHFSSCYAACESGNLVEVQSYFTQDTSLISQVNCEGQTLMHIAVEKDHFQIVEWLHQQDPTLIHKADKKHHTPLHTAAFNEQIAILKFFIKELKANAPLVLQIAQKDCPKTLAFLLEQGVDPNTSNSSLQTLLHLAAEAGLEKNVLCLLQHGAKVNEPDLAKRTPLFLAVIQNHKSIVKLLIQQKADLKAVNEEQETVLHVAAAYGHKQLLEELLNSPVCKKMIEAKDLDGKTALHKSVWGDQKLEIVNILMEHEADPNAKNNYGYTPLHWAAKHGHIKSAQALLRRVDLGESANINNHLPFDLAIRFDQDDFIRFFLGTKEKLQMGKPSSDLEGFYSKCLLQAKKENLVEEQILYLLKLSAIYIEKAEGEKEKGKKENFLFIGAKILNCAMILLKKDNSLFQDYLLNKLEEIEKLFLNIQGTKIFIKKNAIRDTRARLKEIRKTAETSHEKGKPIQETLRRMTRDFKQILSQFIADTQELLGPPPVTWACIGMGSMSRGEMCPYSDIEFAFLIEKESPKGLDYFRTLSKILELKVINLGETKFPVFGGRYESPTPDGFCMDSAGNTPLGVTGIYELIGTPKQLAQFQSVKWMERNIILPNAMSNVCLVAGSEKLEASYNKQKKKVQQLQEKKEGMQRKNDEELAMRLLGGHLIEFSPDLSKVKEEETAFGVKKELYRPFQEILGCLSLLYDLKEKSTFGRIDELELLNVFSLEGAENLKKAINQVLSLRLQVHLFYKDEKEFLCHPEQGKPQDPCLYYFNEQNLNDLHGIYKVLLPFHKAASEFYRTQKKEALNQSTFYDDSPSVQGVTFEKTLQYAKAQEMCQQAVSLNPNDVDALLHLGVIEEKMGKSQDALSRCLKALEIARKKYGENHPDVARSYNNIGEVYDSLGDYEKALEYQQKALKIKHQVLEENHPDVARSYNNIGLVYHRLGDYEKALEYYHKDLKIGLQVLGENHPDVATSYNNIGSIYDNHGDYEKALEYHQKALKIRLQVLGENHPSVATSYNNISFDYYSLGDYEKAVEYQQKALKIKHQVLGENHPDVARIYNNIGSVYRNLGDYEKALEYRQKALKIYCQVLGENHPDVARSYNNIGAVYDSLGDYEKALEYQQKALKIYCQVLGENHPDVATSYNNIGLVYYHLGDYEKALEYYQKALKIGLQVLGENHPSVATSYNNIGLVYKKLGDYEKALEYHQRALKVKCQVLGENHPDVDTCYNNIGEVYRSLGDYEKALEYLQKSLKIQCHVLGENHPDVAASYTGIGTTYYQLGDNEKALDYFKMAVEIQCKTYKQSHPNILHALDWLIIVAEKNQPSQLKTLKPTYALCVETLGAEHELTKKLSQLIES